MSVKHGGFCQQQGYPSVDRSAWQQHYEWMQATDAEGSVSMHRGTWLETAFASPCGGVNGVWTVAPHGEVRIVRPLLRSCIVSGVVVG